MDASRDPRARDVTVADTPAADDAELEALLREVYVGGGFTPEGLAASMFRADAVRARGALLCARDAASGVLLGCVVLAGATSPARRLAAGDGECEMHLLAVSPTARGRGVGRALVDAVLARARADGHTRMILWTQPAMRAAQALYESVGFVREPRRDFEREGRRFLVYAVAL